MKNQFLINSLIFFLILKFNINIELNDIEDNSSLLSIAKITIQNLQEFPFKKELGFNYTNYYFKNISIISIDEPTQLIIENIQPFILISNDSDIIVINEEDQSFSFKELFINLKFNLKIIHYSNTTNSTIEIYKSNLFSNNKVSNLIFKKRKTSERFDLFNHFQDDKLISKIDILDNNLFFSKKTEILTFISDSIKNSTLNYLKNIIFYYPQSEAQRRLQYMCEYLSNNATYRNYMTTGLNKIVFRKTDYLMDLDGTIRSIVFNIDFSVSQRYYSNEYAYAYNVTFTSIFNCEKFVTSFSNKVVDKDEFFNSLAQIVEDNYFDGS